MITNELRVGDVVTECWYSDRKALDVLAVTKTTATLRYRRPVLVKPAVMEQGGFCAMVIDEAVWRTETDLTERIVKAHVRQGALYTGNGKVIPGDHYYHDYGF